ncbi:unnamed protein product [Ambrosiozyma monospora]|uniref:Unnamed protein product n=1 Tax=Ambrosiozyma monospora TaxID=43982 RepID=A0ACB5TTR5_AMBMO|nr:unnamed protein product [Ambrosiozyma monospora]
MILSRMRTKLNDRDIEIEDLKRKRILDKHQQETEMREMLLLLHTQQETTRRQRPQGPVPLTPGQRARPTTATSSKLSYTPSTPTSSAGGSIRGAADPVNELSKRLKSRVSKSKAESRRLGNAVEPSPKLRDLRLQMDLLERQARDLEYGDFEDFHDDPIPSPEPISPAPAVSPLPPAPVVVDTSKERDIRSLSQLRKRLEYLQRESNTIIKLEGDLSQKELMERRKFEALARLTALQKSMKNLRFEDLTDIDLAGDKTNKNKKTLDPSVAPSVDDIERVDTTRSKQLRKELANLEDLCNNLKFDLSLKGDQAYPPDQDALLEKFESRYSKG